MGNLLQTGNSFQKDVNSIVDQILSLPKVPSTLKFYDKDVVKYIDASVYIKSLYITLDNTNNYPSLCSIIFKMNNLPYFCGSHIKFYQDGKVHFNNNKYFYRINDDSFINDIYSFCTRAINSECPVGYIALDMHITDKRPRAHNNNLLLCKTSENSLNIYLFDPHGQNRKSIWNRRANIFIRHLIESLGKKGIKAQKKDVYNSCRTRGLQRGRQTDPGGYCVLISLFWFYCLLILIKNYEVNFVIENLEKALLQKDAEDRAFVLENPQETGERGLMQTYIKFAGYLVNNTIEQLKRLDNYNNFKKLFIAYALKLTEKAETRDMLKFKVNTVEDDLKLEEEDEIIFSEVESKLESDLGKEEKEGLLPDATAYKGVDGGRCNRDNDCFSHNCVKGICRPYNYNEDDTDTIDEEYIKRIKQKREEYKREKLSGIKIDNKERLRRLREEEEFLREKERKKIKRDNPNLMKEKLGEDFFLYV